MKAEATEIARMTVNYACCEYGSLNCGVFRDIPRYEQSERCVHWRSICGDRNDKRHWYVLEDENPGPPIPHQTASAIFMLQGIEENISTLWDWHDICDKEKGVAR